MVKLLDIVHYRMFTASATNKPLVQCKSGWIPPPPPHKQGNDDLSTHGPVPDASFIVRQTLAKNRFH